MTLPYILLNILHRETLPFYSSKEFAKHLQLNRTDMIE